MTLGNYHFAWPWLGILIFVPYFVMYLKNKGKIEKKSINMGAVPLGLTKDRKVLFLLKMIPWLESIAYCLFILALMRPQKILDSITKNNEGIDIMLILDLSNSMLAKDFEPNRLEAAKEVASEFIEYRPNDRIGLVIFSGNAYAHCPLTIDHRILKQMLASVQTNMLEPGTAIGMGLATAVNRLKSSKAKTKIAILMTDGVEQSDGYIKPNQAIQLAKQLGIKVYCIGIGTTGMALTPVDIRDGNLIYGYAPVEIDEALLNDIASNTGGTYFRATDKSTLKKIYQTINQFEKSIIENKSFRQYSELFRPFLLTSIGLFLLTYFLKRNYLKLLVG